MYYGSLSVLVMRLLCCLHNIAGAKTENHIAFIIVMIVASGRYLWKYTSECKRLSNLDIFKKWSLFWVSRGAGGAHKMGGRSEC